MHYRRDGCAIYIDAKGDPHGDADRADSDANLPMLEIPTLLAALPQLALPRAPTDPAPMNCFRTFWPSV